MASGLLGPIFNHRRIVGVCPSSMSVELPTQPKNHLCPDHLDGYFVKLRAESRLLDIFDAVHRENDGFGVFERLLG